MAACCCAELTLWERVASGANDMEACSAAKEWIGDRTDEPTGELPESLNEELDVALVAASQLGYLSTCAVLVAAGANVDARSPSAERMAAAGSHVAFAWNADAAPAVALAAAGAHVEVVEFLVDEGADVTIVDAHGRDALELCRTTFKGPAHIVEPIIELLGSNLIRPSPDADGQRRRCGKNRQKQSITFRFERRQAGRPKIAELIVPLESIPLLPNGTRKLHSYRLYRAMGSPRTCVAPMVDASELPFRVLCRRYGADAGWSPMIHAVSYASSRKYRAMFFQSCPEDDPVVAQFCANQPAVLLAAARQLHQLHPNVCAVDLNLGCPQRIAQRGFFGSFLQDDMPLVYELVSTMARESPVPLTVKIRILDDVDETLAYAQMIERAGAAMLTVHGRTRKEKDHRKGHADWHIIRKIRDVITIPLIANGSVGCYEDVEACLRISGADAVMSATGLLDNPAMFLPPDKQPTRWQLARDYLQLADKYPPRAGYIARNHLFKFFHLELEAHRDLYRRMVRAHTPRDLQAVVDALEERLRQQPDLSISAAAADEQRAKKRREADADADADDENSQDELFASMFG